MIIKDVTVVTADEQNPVVKDAAITIKGNIIEGITQGGNIPSDEHVIEGNGRIAMPGMLNCHTHVGMTLFRGYADDMPLMEWLRDKIWPLEDKLTYDIVYCASLLGILEMIKAGVTSFAEMYFFMDATAKAAAESGVRASLARGLQGPDEHSDERLEENVRLYNEWNGAGDGRISVMFGPHAVYTCSREYLEKVANVAYKLHAGVHMHLSETRQEVEGCIREHGISPIRLAYEAGLMQNRMIAAHCVYPQEDDIEIMKDNDVRVAYNPVSNMKLGSGFCPASMYIKEGIKLGFGTDGAASNNNLSVMKDMQFAALTEKGRLEDPSVMSAHTAIYTATAGGAAALGMNDVGALRPGMKADIVLLDIDGPHARPMYDPVSHIVYSAKDSDVDTVIIDGKVVMEHKDIKTIDAEKLYYEVERLVKEIEDR